MFPFHLVIYESTPFSEISLCRYSKAKHMPFYSLVQLVKNIPKTKLPSLSVDFGQVPPPGLHVYFSN